MLGLGLLIHLLIINGMSTFHNRSGREACVSLAVATSKNTSPILEAKRVTGRAALRADKTLRPASFLQIGCTSRFVRERLLKFRQRFRERKVVSLQNVHGYDRHLGVLAHTSCSVYTTPISVGIQPDRQGSKVTFSTGLRRRDGSSLRLSITSPPSIHIWSR